MQPSADARCCVSRASKNPAQPYQAAGSEAVPGQWDYDEAFFGFPRTALRAKACPTLPLSGARMTLTRYQPDNLWQQSTRLNCPRPTEFEKKSSLCVGRMNHHYFVRRCFRPPLFL